MKAERAEPKQEFAPVIVTLESQDEVDAIFAVGNDTRICRVLPALDGVYGCLKQFTGNYYQESCDRLDKILD